MDGPVLTILSDFTEYPGPRYRKDGPFSGEQFREELLQPQLERAARDGRQLKVILDGVAGYGSSFLEEAFGGLVRAGVPPEHIANHLQIVAKTPRFEHHRLRALQYIQDALKRAKIRSEKIA